MVPPFPPDAAPKIIFGVVKDCAPFGMHLKLLLFVVLPGFVTFSQIVRPQLAGLSDGLNTAFRYILSASISPL